MRPQYGTVGINGLKNKKKKEAFVSPHMQCLFNGFGGRGGRWGKGRGGCREWSCLFNGFGGSGGRVEGWRGAESGAVC